MTAAGAIYKSFEMKFPVPENGALRIWWVPQIPGKDFLWPVRDLEEAASLLDALAAYDDFQFGENVKGDYCNTGGLLTWDGTEWVDWESEDCDDFNTFRKQSHAR